MDRMKFIRMGYCIFVLSNSSFTTLFYFKLGYTLGKDKKMGKNKILSFVLILAIAFVLSGCTHQYNYNDLMDNATKIEIVKKKYHNNHMDSILIKKLSNEEAKEILSDLAEIEFKTSFGMELPVLGEYGIKVYNKDGSYRIIFYNSSFVDKDNKNISVKRWKCSEEEFDNLIFKFID